MERLRRTASNLRRPPDPRKLRAELIRALAELRIKHGLSQTEVAARMGTSQPALARLESTPEIDPRVSTLERLANALNARIEWRLVPKFGGGHPHASGVSR